MSEKPLASIVLFVRGNPERRLSWDDIDFDVSRDKLALDIGRWVVDSLYEEVEG